ncbi:hypothetical protein [Adlercreutzia sp. ZJ141]|uniref:hypothetical protein n=1 Tax=Adlercreutzia sp. ZJ141 TaxID=2709406 RepID=UPI0013EA9BDD|nr:hypothetical protein [Adlercreutzia sp. ZJ141]
MITTTEKAKTNIYQALEMFGSVGADVDAYNKVTGESIKIDGDTLLSGIQTGLALAYVIIGDPALPRDHSMIRAAMRKATEDCLRRKLNSYQYDVTTDVVSHEEVCATDDETRCGNAERE